MGLALSIVEVLAGRPIINGDPAAMMGIALDTQRRPTPRNEGVDLPDEVEAVFERALALDPRDRPGDVGVFWDDLVNSLGDPHSANPRASGSMPRVTPAVERALAMDLEFDPTSVSKQRLAVSAPVLARDAASSGQHFVPDLELSPAPVRRASGARALELELPLSPAREAPRSPPPIAGGLELDEPSSPSASLDLDLDLPHEVQAPRGSSEHASTRERRLALGSQLDSGAGLPRAAASSRVAAAPGSRSIVIA